jgi:hypothetical protein
VRVDDRVRAALRDREIVVLEEPERCRGEVELVDEQDVRPSALDDLGDRLGLSVVRRREVADELTREVAAATR